MLSLLSRKKTLAPKTLRKGFSINNLLVYIVVVGIIGGVVGTYIFQVVPAAKVKKLNDNAANLTAAAFNFKHAGGTVTTSAGASAAPGSVSTDGVLRADSIANLKADLEGGVYAGGMPFGVKIDDPFTAANYAITVDANGVVSVAPAAGAVTP